MLSLIRIHAFIYQQGMSNDYKSEEPSNQRDTVRPKNTTEGSCLGIDSHIFFIPLPLDSSVNGLARITSMTWPSLEIHSLDRP